MDEEEKFLYERKRKENWVGRKEWSGKNRDGGKQWPMAKQNSN